MSENLQVRETQNADQLAYEINFIKRQTYEYVLKASADIGERLTAAKELVPHGQWTDWLAEKVDYSQSTANNLMKIYREFTGDQLSLSGKTKSQTFGNLTYSQAVALFALPEHQREEFVETHDVSEMSARQLKEAIAAQKAAEAERDQARSDADAANAVARRARELREEATAEADEARNKALEAQIAAERLRKELDAAKEKMMELTAAAAEVSSEERAEIEKEVSIKYDELVSQLTLDVDTERKRAEAIAAEKAALEAKVAQARSDSMVKLNLLFEQSQKTLQDMKRLIEDCPEEQREKLTGLILQTLSRIFGGN